MTHRVRTLEELRDWIEKGESIAIVRMHSPDVWFSAGGELERVSSDDAAQAIALLRGRTLVVVGRDAALYAETLSQQGYDPVIVSERTQSLLDEAYMPDPVYPTIW